MADGFSITLQGWDELIARLEKAPQTIQDQVKFQLADHAEAIAETAKLLAPASNITKGHLGGTLHGSIGVDPPTNNGLSINIFSKANYSAYVEFGTGTKVDVPDNPEGLPEYALTFKGTHEIPGMYARPFFFPAVRQQIPKIIESMTKILEKI